MKLGVFTVLFGDLSFEEMLDRVKATGLETVEVGTGGYPGNAHCPLDELLEDEGKRKRYLEEIVKRGLEISALSCHGNPLSPNQDEAANAHEQFTKTLRLANLLDVPVVNGFSGTPGSGENSRETNWPVVPWPSQYSDIYEWQWEKKIIPYWKETGKIAEDYGVKIGLELHGGFSVHTPHTMLKLSEEAGTVVGANLDPSHMWWQGIDPVAAIRILGEAGVLHHFHAKDTYLNQENINRYGLLDMQPYAKVGDRAWTFRTVGYGHSVYEWAEMISALRTYGYDHAISIEHEDPIMSIEEGFTNAVKNLQSIIIREPASEMWWA
ncbi:sugar phosphate isomerase/epimerase [Geomicrobium halophilum]|uniref:Sugar phosphate isomerase/epimerase n=1 Tax=Geomicrobium halophilum TaxID=549000 RepID=A0A841PZ03_9BACL|nr:sugar phosphate isomerase/epimerase [Geomicrobium halophilum]MBB6450023.1 sugar phosphate isomerase/epimerase [Geomicrobium halophilum]